MNTRTLYPLKAALLAIVLAGSMQPVRTAAESASDAAGLYKLTFLGNSDTIVSVPFSRPPVANAMLNSIAGNTIQVRGKPNWISNQFVYAAGVQSNTYYLRFDSGTKEGHYFAISGNGTNDVTLNLGNDSLAGVTHNDKLSIVPYWTLGTVFPGGKGLFPSTSIFALKSEVLIPNYTGAGINLSAAATYYFLTNTTTGAASWRLIGSSSTNRNDDVLPPNVYIVIRNLVGTNSTFTSIGGVILTKIATPLSVNLTNKQDNPLALTRPVSVSLDDSGLIASGAFTPTTSIFSIQDQLLAFDNTTTNFNKSAAATYYYFNGAWRKVGASASINFGPTNVFTPGTGFIIRKVNGSTAPVWLNSATY